MIGSQMPIRLFIFLFLFAFSSARALSADLPKELVGVWASPASEFERESLIGGVALYLLGSGKAALVGAPLPVRRCEDGRICTPIIGAGGTVTYDAASGRLTLVLGDGRQDRTVQADYRATDASILLQGEPGNPTRLLRRSVDIPVQLADKLNTSR